MEMTVNLNSPPPPRTQTASANQIERLNSDLPTCKPMKISNEFINSALVESANLITSNNSRISTSKNMTFLQDIEATTAASNSVLTPHTASSKRFRNVQQFRTLNKSTTLNRTADRYGNSRNRYNQSEILKHTIKSATPNPEGTELRGAIQTMNSL